MMKERKLTLLPNLQFIYELHMARLEAITLTDGSVVASDFRSFTANGKTDAELVKRRSAYVGEIDGEPTDYARLTKKMSRARLTNTSRIGFIHTKANFIRRWFAAWQTLWV